LKTEPPPPSLTVKHPKQSSAPFPIITDSLVQIHLLQDSGTALLPEPQRPAKIQHSISESSPIVSCRFTLSRIHAPPLSLNANHPKNPAHLSSQPSTNASSSSAFLQGDIR
jgi:hypothetical protein